MLRTQLFCRVPWLKNHSPSVVCSALCRASLCLWRLYILRCNIAKSLLLCLRDSDTCCYCVFWMKLPRVIASVLCSRFGAQWCESHLISYFKPITYKHFCNHNTQHSRQVSEPWSCRELRWKKKHSVQHRELLISETAGNQKTPSLTC